MLIKAECQTAIDLTLLVEVDYGDEMYLADDVLTLSRLRVGRCGYGFVVLPAGGEWNEEECREGKR